MLALDPPLHKRKTLPTRSLSIPDFLTPQEKHDRGIVVLDVYKLFLSSPETLLRSSSSSSLNALIPTDAIDMNEGIAALNSPDFPAIYNGVIDMDYYKDTRNAPSVVWKKGGDEAYIRRRVGHLAGGGGI